MDAVHAHETELVEYALKRLGAMPDITLYGPKDAGIHGSAVSFNHNVVHAHDAQAAPALVLRRELWPGRGLPGPAAEPVRKSSPAPKTTSRQHRGSDMSQ